MRESGFSKDKFNPPIVRAALDGNMATVVAALDAGVAVDTCGTWVESEWKMGGYEKSWTWKKDTALTMACSQGNLPLVQLLLARGANPEHSVCNDEDVHYTGAKIAREHGHLTCADWMDRVIDELDAPRRARAAQMEREAAIKLRDEARRLRAAGPPYPSDAGGVSPQTFARAAKDFMHGLGSSGGYSAWCSEGGTGVDVDRAEGVAFAILALEVLKTQPQFLPSTYDTASTSTVLKVIGLLREVPDVAAAREAVAAWAEHATAEQERRRLANERANEEVKRKRQAAEQRRALEVARCRRIWPSQDWQNACTDNRCGFTQAERDRCTYGHRDHDLPPRCRWGASCLHGDSCRFNHLGM